MEGIIRVPSHTDVMLTKLSYKVINHGINVIGGVYKYENDECLHMIIDNLFIYIKFVIRIMAQHKRKFRVMSPLLIQKVGNETEKRSEESMNEEGRESEVGGNKRLMSWQTKLDLKKIKINDTELFEENNLKDVEEKGRQNERIFNSMIWKPQNPTHEECMDIDTEADICKPSTSREGMDVEWEAKRLKPFILTSGEDMDANKETFIDEDKKEDKCKDSTKDNKDNEINKCDEKEVKRDKQVSKDDGKGEEDDNEKDEDDEKDGDDDEEEEEEEVDKIDEKEDKRNTVEYIIPEIIYSPGAFGVRDLLQLLMRNPHVIPKRSLHQVSVMRALNKLGPKPTGVKI